MSNLQAFVDGGKKPPTKKALREAVAANPATVTFMDTSAFNNRGTIGVEDLTPADVIVGPDVYNARNWYANVRNGRVV